ncbi:DUF5681 domain-containing protein [Congregibacter litoralis]|uniref:DUF5681 domain-containing protein n=1 Tax=Congregibacter litoralis KT71 TaxID=314285 RepID=A4ACV1_9GAMM|nr:DUF5681 domain-containing protein [Congregibacter litoralis]EAQ96142.1 hypothetical protein KT71_18791 [Congregibacter litoralis KT71]
MSDKDYEVGFGKPPKHTQFKKGQSGNPKGRPKGIKNLNTDLEEELNQKIIITEGGISQEITKQRAMIKTLFVKAMKGDTRAAGVLINLTLGLENSRIANDAVEKLTPDDIAILDAFKQKVINDTIDSQENE